MTRRFSLSSVAPAARFLVPSLVPSLVLALGPALGRAQPVAAPVPAEPSAVPSAVTVLGDVRSAVRVAGGVLLRAEHGSVLVESIAGVGARVRVRFADAGTPAGGLAASAFPAPRSLATGDAPPALGTATLRDAGDTVVIGVAAGVEVRATRHPLRLAVRDAAGRMLLTESFGAARTSGKLAHYVEDPAGTRYLGLGEQPTGMLRNGQAFTFWNTDRFAYERGNTPLYSSFPFYLGVRDGQVHGVLYDNPFRGEMEFANRLPGSIGYVADGGIDGGELRWYVIPGPGMDSVLARYTRLTGRTPLPPRWAVGYHQSRYSYHPDTMVTNVATEFRRRDIPADALHLDIHYMDGYRVFTWNPVEFPQPRRLVDSLGALGLKVVTIVDPGVKRDTAYRLFRDGLARAYYLTTPDGRPALGKVWPDTSAFPDFTRAAVRAWWGAEQRVLTDAGVRGVWNDMNEPSSFFGGTLSELVSARGDGRPLGNAEWHNQYGTYMAQASYEGFRALQPERRPFLIIRAGYTGAQRYTSVWTGDNNSTWDHLRLSIPMVLSLGLTGVPFAGSDVGGFTGAPSADLYARWMQAATLVPLFRTHSAIDTPRREPWSFGPDVERSNRATIRLRYRLLPAVYTAFDQHARTGAPVVRPVAWSTPGDTAALGVNDQYLLGDHLLAAPVVDSAADARAVYLPAGRWYRLAASGADSAYDGGRRVTVSAPRPVGDGGDTTGLRGLPLFARAGAVVPMQPVTLHDGARALDTLTLHVFPGAPGTPGTGVTSELYEDAGDGYAYTRGASRRTTFRTATTATGGLALSLAQAGNYPGARAFIVVVHAVDRPRPLTADGRALPVTYDAGRRTATVTVPAAVRRVELAP